MGRATKLAALTVWVVGAGACVDPEPFVSVLSTPDGPLPDIAFLHSWRLHVLLPKERRAQQLTHLSEGFDFEYSWAPDGSALAFAHGEINRQSAAGVYVVTARGQVQRQITFPTKRYDRYPQWSPDGTRIAFAREEFLDAGGLYVVKPDGTELEKLISSKIIEGLDWSPDGQQLVIGGAAGFVRGIVIVAADGASFREIAEGQHPQWSPDGGAIAFDHDGDIFVADISGNDVLLRNLTAEIEPSASHPTWSPNGDRIAFPIRTSHDGTLDIFVMQRHGNSPAVGVTDGFNLDSFGGFGGSEPVVPAWDPRDNLISFTLHGRIFIVNADGGMQRSLTTEGAASGTPAYRPIRTN